MQIIVTAAVNGQGYPVREFAEEARMPAELSSKKALQEFLGICIAEEKCIGSGAFRCAIKEIALAQNGYTLVYMPD